ncbi:MAG: hypothetical protein EHM72_17555 [Calditrichaeota bacterium]|nr:MAG: hypothetical protein EHM72_17555 [Calditrichota bacterium]
MDSDIFIVAIVFGSIVFVIKNLSDNRLRRYLVQQGQVNENLQYLYRDRLAYSVPTALKWGMVLLAIGLAVMVGEIVGGFARLDEPVVFALMFIFGGAALIAYYFIATRMAKKEQN